MYLDYFGLMVAPYRITPDTELFYAGGERGAILDALVYAIVSGEAITKVVGEVGSGKTMLCRMLEHKLPKTVEIVYLANPSLAPEDVLHAIAFELELPVRDDDNRLKVMKALQEYLLARHANSRQVVVFVEEAQGMPLATLEEIRLLSNLETQQHKLLQVVLFGQPELDVGLSAPHVRQIKERITNSFYLPPLKRRETSDYLTFRLHLAGFRGAPVFSYFATHLIALYSAGLMRRINIIADKAMLSAYATGSQTVKLKHVISALRDCEFIKRGVLLRPLLASIASVCLVVGVSAWAQFESNITVAAVPVVENIIDQPSPAAVQPIVSHVVNTIKNETPRILFDERIEKSEEWLATAEPSHLTVQLLRGTPHEMEAFERFLLRTEKEGLLPKMFVYRTSTDAVEVINVVMGEYSTLSQARAALEALPQSLARYQPYLRNVKNVLSEASVVTVATESRS